MLWAERMLRRSAKTELVVEASRKVHTTIGLLSLPEVGVCQAVEALMDLKMASWRNSAANSRFNLVMVPSGLVNLTNFRVMSTDHLTRQV